MSIAFGSDEIQLEKLPERLRQMSDDELIKFGRSGQRSPPGSWEAKLEETRAEPSGGEGIRKERRVVGIYPVLMRPQRLDRV
jgi:hypothetical protein